MAIGTHLLVVATFIGGSAQGPMIHTQHFSSAKQCEIARQAVVSAVDEAAQIGGNRTEGGKNLYGRTVVTARCASLNEAAR